ncbi:MAG: hypothetical protein WCT01_03015 [Candidatus Shapirobacteria bacterium]|jgi:hypothetical protein
MIKKNDYLKVYMDFLVSEIPNIIQIISSFSLIVFIIPRKATFIIVALALVIILINSYLGHRFYEFEKSQILEKYSILNLKKLDDKTMLNKHENYLLITTFFLGAISALIGFSILNSPR